MATRTKKSPSPITTTRVPGLQGAGLIQLGSVSKLELRDRLQMPRATFGRIVNVSERTLAKVEKADPEQVAKLRRPYNEVYGLWKALSEVIDPGALGVWFGTPNEAFDGLKPIEVIERGEIHRLWEMAFQLRSGTPG